jgi:hypothetical protein
MESDSIERVFVLGSGVSKHCGYPLTNELIKDITQRLDAKSRDGALIHELIGVLYPNFNLDYKIYPNIEDVLSLIPNSTDLW